MNPIQFFEYGRSRITAIQPNTFIGGVAATIPTKEDLATKLGISSANISYFAVVGANIEVRITVNYTVTSFENDVNITYYRNTDAGKVIAITKFRNAVNLYDVSFPYLTEILDSYVFRNTKLKNVVLQKVTKLTQLSVFQDTPTLKTIELPELIEVTNTASTDALFRTNSSSLSIYMPKATILGGDATIDQKVFYLIPIGAVLYLSPTLATNNNGGEDADVDYARNTRSAVIRYVDNYTSPSLITNLSIGSVLGGAMRLDFTPPSSTNSIDYYEVWVDGIYNNNISGTGKFVTGLNSTTLYSIEVKPVDIYYNKSSSNIVSQTTASTYNIPTANLISYYKLNESSGNIAVDSVNAENLTLTNLTLNQTGLVDKSILSTVASSRAKTTSAATSIIGDFSLSILCYRTANGTGGNNVIADQGDFGSNSGFGIWMNTSGVLSWRINQNYNHYLAAATLPLNQWVLVILVYNGSTVKIYKGHEEKISAAITTNPNPSNSRTLFNRGALIESFIGKQEAVGFWNIALLPDNIIEIDSRFQLGQHLI